MVLLHCCTLCLCFLFRKSQFSTMKFFVLVVFAFLQLSSAFQPIISQALQRPYRRTVHMALPAETKKNKRGVIFGATGYIGKFVAKESIRRGYETVAFVREQSGAGKDDFFKGCEVIYGDVTDEENIRYLAFTSKTDVVISCLASRSGTKSDSYKIDYQATLNTLNAARSAKVGQYILLSAFCVKKPLLQFQFAKLKFEQALTAAGDITFSIVRPNAYFKSVSGQMELLQQGWPFVMFGDGSMCKCNPIAESDLGDQPPQYNTYTL